MSIQSQIKEIREVDKIETFYQVVKSNVLIDSIQSFSSNEFKIILSIISLINPTNTDENMIYRITVSSLKEILGNKDTAFYSKLKKMTFNILSKPIWYEDKKNNQTIQASWFSICRYKNGEGVIEVEIHPDIRHLLVDLKKNYTTYMLENVIKLKSKHSIRIYQLLKRVERIRSATFRVDELRTLLNINNKYKQYNQFKVKVLEVAKKEINKNTDIMFSYKELKTGKKIDRIKFNISTNKKNIKPDKSIDLFELNETGYKLISYKISQSKVVDIIKNYEDDYINERINQFLFEIEDNPEKVNNIGKGKYLYNLIKHTDWINDKYVMYKNNQVKLKENKKKKEESKRLKELQIEYNEYIRSFIKHYDTLEDTDRKIVDTLVKKETNKLIGNKFLKPETVKSMKQDILEDILLNEVKKEHPSFEEWIRNR